MKRGRPNKRVISLYSKDSSNPRWVTLAERKIEERQQLHAEKLAICNEIKRRGKPYDPTVAEIAARYDNRRGFQKKSIRGMFDRWMSSGCDPNMLLPYGSLVRDKTSILKRHQLSTDEIRSWLKRNGFTTTSWAEAHGFLPGTVRQAITGERIGGKCVDAMDLLAKEIKGEVEVLAAMLRDIRSDWEKLGAKIEHFARQLDAQQRKVSHR